MIDTLWMENLATSFLQAQLTVISEKGHGIFSTSYDSLP